MAIYFFIYRLGKGKRKQKKWKTRQKSSAQAEPRKYWKQAQAQSSVPADWKTLLPWNTRTAKGRLVRWRAF